MVMVPSVLTEGVSWFGVEERFRRLRIVRKRDAISNRKGLILGRAPALLYVVKHTTD
jgi:hypothetical protein